MRILSNEDLEKSCDMVACIGALYEGIRSYSRGDAARRPRVDLFAPTSRSDEFVCFSTMDGVVRGKYYALRIKPDVMSWPKVDGMQRRVTYCREPGLYGGLVLLFDGETAELRAIMNDGYVQHMRVGALAALGVRYLARPDAQVLAMIGSGGMARSFARGVIAERPIQRIQAYSPTRENLLAYCAEMTEALDIEVIPVATAEDAVREADIVATCTNAMDPVIENNWLRPGMHLASVTGREIGPEVMQRVNLVGEMLHRTPLHLGDFSDDNFEIRMNVLAYVAGQPDERAKIPSPPAEAAIAGDARIVPCIDWMTETARGRESAADITILAELCGGVTAGLASSGIQGLQFAAVAGRAYELAAAQGGGQELPTDMFLQTIPT